VLKLHGLESRPIRSPRRPAGIAGIQLQGAAPVPEPATAALFALGALALIGLVRWRRIA
jgi:hypothetical protein